jgi:SNF2 family DNA or RNA helicase
LSNGAILNLKDENFQNMNESLERLSIDEEDIQEKMTAPLWKGLTVFEDDFVDKGEQFRKLMRDLLEPSELEFDKPKLLEADLRSYQQTGFKWLKTLNYYGLGGILADDMGLGKTIQTIAYIVSEIEEGQEPFLVVCPSSVLFNWEREFEKFAPQVETKIIQGSKEERIAILEEVKEENTPVLITSYPLIQRDYDLYTEQQFASIILDEAQYVKNRFTKTSRAVKQLRSETIFALSGTPIENSLHELYSIFSIVQPGLFENETDFKESSTTRIAEKVRPFVLRRLKSEVLDDLPEKTETTEYIELSDDQKKLYQSQLAVLRNEVSGYLEDDTFQNNRLEILSGMTRLRQICNDPGLVLEDYDGASSKLARLLEYLEEARLNGKRVVLFSQFTKMLDIIREELDERGYDYHYLDGSTPKEKRFEDTSRFNRGEKDLFLISLKAGGTGLNLTGGDTVILYDSWWNPAVEDQAADRVHRFGQKKVVQVVRLITRGTIEERIHELQDQKRALLDTVIDSGTSEIASLTKDDVLKMLEM